MVTFPMVPEDGLNCIGFAAYVINLLSVDRKSSRKKKHKEVSRSFRATGYFVGGGSGNNSYNHTSPPALTCTATSLTVADVLGSWNSHKTAQRTTKAQAPLNYSLREKQ